MAIKNNKITTFKAEESEVVKNAFEENTFEKPITNAEEIQRISVDISKKDYRDIKIICINSLESYSMSDFIREAIKEKLNKQN